MDPPNRTWAWLVWLLLAASGLELSEGERFSGGSRFLAQAACPDFCSSCFKKGNGAWTCNTCAPSFVKIKNSCVCSFGRYVTAVGTCRICPRDYYCLRGLSAPVKCPGNLVTSPAGGGVSIWSCVNPPGYSYMRTAAGPRANICRNSTYSVGYDQNVQCTPCPSGFETDPNDPLGTYTNISACKAPPGFMGLSDGVVPCAVGTFSTSYNAMGVSCISCTSVTGAGLTTGVVGASSADSCYFVEKGYAPVDGRQLVMLQAAASPSAVISAKRCPQNYYCPGGDPTAAAVVLPCPNGRKTQGEGAESVNQCTCAPGYFLNTATDSCEACPNGSFKEGWSTIDACTACKGGSFDGDAAGWQSEANMPIIQLDPNYGAAQFTMFVRGNSTACFISKGMGSLFYTVTSGVRRIRAITCPSGFYSKYSSNKYGQNVIPCKGCPAYQVTECTGVADPTDCRALLAQYATPVTTDVYQGAWSQAACVHKPAWGWVEVSWNGGSESGNFSMPCPQNTTNIGGNNASCVACAGGTYTPVEGTYPCVNL